MPNGLEQENRNANSKVVPLQLDGAVIMSTNTQRKPGLADTAIGISQIYFKSDTSLVNITLLVAQLG